MGFRNRMLLGFCGAALIPMAVLAVLVRRETTDRLTEEYGRRVDSLAAVIEADIAREEETVAASLDALRRAILDDNRFRRAAVDQDPAERRYLLDYASSAMALSGLSMLQIQDGSGRILSSGHFRNEYDRLEPGLPEMLATTPDGTALIRARAPDAPFFALVRLVPFEMGGRRFTIVGGIEIGRAFLARLTREKGLTVSLIPPGARPAPAPGAAGVEEPPGDDGTIVRELTIPFIDADRRERADARIRVSHDLGGLDALRRGIDRWFAAVLAISGILAALLAIWIAARISRPLTALAEKTERVDLRRLDIDFETDRADEIGVLSRLLGRMTDRLRAGAARLREAERRATRGELARQVNHDIKNGLVPIRNVFRHLAELARDDPDRLPAVFDERRGTLDSSIAYLEDLASSYARLSLRGARRPCDVNEAVRRVLGDARGRAPTADLRMEPAEGAVVLADPVALRRILENLVDNAVDSLEGGRGGVTVAVALDPGGEDGPRVRIRVEDGGCGMTAEERARVFDDFYTTKAGGTGLGLSIVRRLVGDLAGSIRVEGPAGGGSRFIVDLPAAPAGEVEGTDGGDASPGQRAAGAGAGRPRGGTGR